MSLPYRESNGGGGLREGSARQTAARPRDGDTAIFERLAQRLEHMLLELG